MKHILYLICGLLLLALAASAQETPPPSQYLKPVNGQFFIDTRDSAVWQYMGTPFGWQKKPRYKDVLSLSVGTVVTSIPTIGLSTPNVQALINGFYQSQPPTATLTGGTSHELTSASTINVTYNYSYGKQAGTQNIDTTSANGVKLNGSRTGITQNMSGASGSVVRTIATNTTTISTLVANTIDGKSVSASTSDTWLPKRYAVWLSDTTGIKTAGFNDALITGSTLVNQLSSSKSYSFSTGAATGKFLAIVYVASVGALTGISINGVGSIGAFNSVTRNLTNAQGYTQSYRIYYNTQAQTTTGYDIITN